MFLLDSEARVLEYQGAYYDLPIAVRSWAPRFIEGVKSDVFLSFSSSSLSKALHMMRTYFKVTLYKENKLECMVNSIYFPAGE